MSASVDDIDQPTVTRRLSPRARASLAGDSRRVADDGGDEPTVVVQRHAGPAPEAQAAGTSSLQSAARIVQQLEAMPERTLVRFAAPLLLMVAQLRNSIE